jgi:hypothetical protein
MGLNHGQDEDQVLQGPGEPIALKLVQEGSHAVADGGRGREAAGVQGHPTQNNHQGLPQDAQGCL